VRESERVVNDRERGTSTRSTKLSDRVVTRPETTSFEPTAASCADGADQARPDAQTAAGGSSLRDRGREQYRRDLLDRGFCQGIKKRLIIWARGCFVCAKSDLESNDCLSCVHDPGDHVLRTRCCCDPLRSKTWLVDPSRLAAKRCSSMILR